jgi:hypothetical protein
MKISLNNLGHGIYTVKGAEHVMISSWSGRSWNGREGSIAVTTWTATDRSQEDATKESLIIDGKVKKPFLIIATASTLTKLRAKLEKALKSA